MSLFGGMRDARFLAAINSELLNAIIDTEILFYKLVVEHIQSNIYGESNSKTYFDAMLIPSRVTKNEKTSNNFIGVYPLFVWPLFIRADENLS